MPNAYAIHYNDDLERWEVVTPDGIEQFADYQQDLAYLCYAARIQGDTSPYGALATITHRNEGKSILRRVLSSWPMFKRD